MDNQASEVRSGFQMGAYSLLPHPGLNVMAYNEWNLQYGVGGPKEFQSL